MDSHATTTYVARRSPSSSRHRPSRAVNALPQKTPLPGSDNNAGSGRTVQANCLRRGREIAFPRARIESAIKEEASKIIKSTKASSTSSLRSLISEEHRARHAAPGRCLALSPSGKIRSKTRTAETAALASPRYDACAGGQPRRLNVSGRVHKQRLTNRVKLGVYTQQPGRRPIGD